MTVSTGAPTHPCEQKLIGECSRAFLVCSLILSTVVVGQIPPEIAKCTALQKLDLKYNAFEGPCAHSLSEMGWVIQVNT